MVLGSLSLKDFMFSASGAVRAWGLCGVVPFLQLLLDENMLFSPKKAMAPHSSTLAWKIPRTEEPGGLPSMGSHRVRHT